LEDRWLWAEFTEHRLQFGFRAGDPMSGNECFGFCQSFCKGGIFVINGGGQGLALQCPFLACSDQGFVGLHRYLLCLFVHVEQHFAEQQCW
jgi:hypothetical protein